MTNSSEPKVYGKPGRLASIDALRGFDMFWIMGGEFIFHGLAKDTEMGLFVWMSYQLEHSPWDGFRFYDMIFPLFLFLAGVSMPFSFGHRLERGDTKQTIYRHAVKRMLLLVFFGMLYNGFLQFDWETMRYASVLARIGLGWFFAALIFLNTNERQQYYWFGGILVFYFLLLRFVPPPGGEAYDLTTAGSLVAYIDRLLLPGHLYLDVHDPEGILSTIPAISTALMGVLAGHFLKDQQVSGKRKTLIILVAGVVSIMLGELWGLYFPVNKNLWTSTFVLVAGGWSLLLLGLFYWVIDVMKFRKWAFFFIVIGLNPITIYLAQSGIIDFQGASEYFFHGIVHLFPTSITDILNAIGYTFISWVFLYILYRKKIFLKV